MWAGNLLFNSGAYEDAIKAYSHSDLINEDETLLYLRAKCFLVLKDVNAANEDFNRIIGLKPNKNVAFDRACLNALKTALDDKIVDRFP